MKTKITLLFCLLSLLLNAQEIPKLNVGIDFMFFGRGNINGYGDLSYAPRGGVFVEKAFQLNFLKQTYISPGLSYKTIHEEFESIALGGSSFSELNHHSLSSYLKLIHRTGFKRIEPAVFYYGAYGGVHLLTRASGEASGSGIAYEPGSWENKNYKQDPSELFRNPYFGFLLGIELTNNSRLKPSIEFRFLPRYGEYREDEILSSFELAINFGLVGGKKNRDSDIL